MFACDTQTRKTGYVCPYCEIDPSSHSFRIMRKDENKIIYYTCPVEATNTSTKPILAHYEGLLKDKGNTPWYWIIDFKDFGPKHAMEVTTAMELTRLIVKYSDTLKKVIVINSNIYMRAIMNIVTPFFNEKVRNVITIKVPNKSSRLEYTPIEQSEELQT